MSAEGGFVDVLLCPTDLVKSLAQVQLGETRGRTKLVKKLVNGGHGKTVLDGYGVKGAIIDTTAPAAILFFNEEDGG